MSESALADESKGKKSEHLTTPTGFSVWTPFALLVNSWRSCLMQTASRNFASTIAAFVFFFFIAIIRADSLAFFHGTARRPRRNIDEKLLLHRDLQYNLHPRE